MNVIYFISIFFRSVILLEEQEKGDISRIIEEIKIYAKICKIEHSEDKPEEIFELLEIHFIPNFIPKMYQFQHLPLDW